MSPTFTTGKLKVMLEPIEGICDKTIDYISKQLVEKNHELDMKPVIQGFTLDSISKVAFGLDTNVHKGENQEFAKIAYDVFAQFSTENWTNTILFNILQHFPEVTKMMGFWPESAKKIRQMTHDLIEDRMAKNIDIGDFIGRLKDYKKVAEPPITGDMIDAQGMVFLTAGFETTANTLGSLMFHLATHPDIQTKVYDEICDSIGPDEEVTHETIQDLHYLEACVLETLRIWPPIVERFRTCTNDCTIKGLKIKKGVLIKMPIYAAHFNDKFFPEPNKFMPDRFLKENADNIIPYTWRPFGAGNRVCIGQRFAIMEIKIFVAKLLRKFKITKTTKTELKNPIGTYGMLTYPEIIVSLSSRH